MSDRGWFWVCYFAALLGVVVFAIGCAQSFRPFTPAEQAALECRVMSERICGTHPYSFECRKTAVRECRKFQRDVLRAGTCAP